MGQLRERRGIHARGMVRIDRLDRRQDCDLGRGQSDRVRELDGVCENIDLVLQAGGDIHDRIRHHQRLVVGREIEPEDVAHAPRGSHVGVAAHRRPAVRRYAATPSSAPRLRRRRPMPPPSARPRSDRLPLRQAEILETCLQRACTGFDSTARSDQHGFDDAFGVGGKCRGERVRRTGIGDGDRQAPLAPGRGFEGVQLRKCRFSRCGHEVRGCSVRVAASILGALCRTGSFVRIFEGDIRVTGA